MILGLIERYLEKRETTDEEDIANIQPREVHHSQTQTNMESKLNQDGVYFSIRVSEYPDNVPYKRTIDLSSMARESVAIIPNEVARFRQFSWTGTSSRIEQRGLMTRTSFSLFLSLPLPSATLCISPIYGYMQVFDSVSL